MLKYSFKLDQPIGVLAQAQPGEYVLSSSISADKSPTGRVHVGGAFGGTASFGGAIRLNTSSQPFDGFVAELTCVGIGLPSAPGPLLPDDFTGDANLPPDSLLPTSMSGSAAILRSREGLETE